MSVAWTKDQEKAISSFGRGAVVSAAAGSGKTAVLVERVIRLLSDSTKAIPADKLLAVTFTTDAAAQMRDKLNTAFEKKLEKDPSDPWLLQQRDLVQLASICTIDSFCFELVKENLDKFQFQGGIKILGEADEKLLFETSCIQALEELCAQEPESYAMLDNFFGADSYGQLQGMVRSLYDHLRMICHREQWLESSLEKYESDETYAMLKDHMFQTAERDLARAGRLLDDARYCYSYVVEAGGKELRFSDQFGTAEHNMSEAESLFMTYKLAFDHRDINRLLAIEFPKYKMFKQKASTPEEFKEMFKTLGERMRDDLKEMNTILSGALDGFRLSDDHYRANLRSARRIFETICGLEKRVEEIELAVKLERNMVDFNDVELMAKELLVEETPEGFRRTELAEEIRRSGMYAIILIDEYQDVNDLQEIIFKAVSDTDDLSFMGKNTFIVGDLKQAIYGFRKTNPDLFKHCIEQASDSDNSQRLEHISLRQNFRSRREVLGLSNFIFETLMSTGCGQVDYNEDERLEAGAAYTDRPSPSEIMLISYDEQFDPKAMGFPRELYETALRIRQLIDAGEPVCDNGVDRPCRQSDFCILVDRNVNKKLAADALSFVGLSAVTEDTAGYIRSREISLALDLLRIVDSPMNDIAMTAVMMSPIGGFSPDEMARVRTFCRVMGTRKMNRIFQVLSGASRDPDTNEKYAKYVDLGDEVLQEKCKSLFRTIESLRYCAVSMSLERLIRRIFEVTELMAITSLYLDPAKKRANLRLLLEYAADYEASSSEGITGFLRYIDSVSGNNKAFKNAVSVKGSGDCVNIKTYHKSKGLEYPFVFLCTLGSKMLKDRSDDVKLRLHKDLGFGFELNDRRLNVRRRNLYDDYLYEILDSETRSERMRLFYVGCTRARERLFMVLCEDKQGRTGAQTVAELRRDAVRACAAYEQIPAFLLHEQKDLLTWAVMCLSKHENRGPLEDWLGMSLETFPVSSRCGQADITYHVCKYSAPEALEPLKPAPPMPGDPAMALRLRERYKKAVLDPRSMLPAKLTVTEVVRMEKERDQKDKAPEFFPNLPRLSEEVGRLSAAEKGTYTHKFMELADLDRAALSVRDELERLVSDGKMSKREAKGVYISSLESFFASPFFTRMRSSSDLRREQRFLVEVKDLGLDSEMSEYTGGEGFIQGIADCIFKETDGWVLVDYKTDNFHSAEEMGRYSTQLRLYKAAFELIYGEPVKASYIYSFKLGQGREFAL